MRGGKPALVSPSVEVDADAGPALVVPSAVGVPGEKTVWLRLIAAAVGQRQLENLRMRTDVQVLLKRGRERIKKEEDKEQSQPYTQRQKPERDQKEEER